MIKKGMIVWGLLTALSSYAQDVSPYQAGNLPEGIVYFLPRTELQIKVTVTESQYIPGEFCQYADRYLRLQNISSQRKEEWEIKSIEVTPFGVPNPELAYSI